MKFEITLKFLEIFGVSEASIDCFQSLVNISFYLQFKVGRLFIVGIFEVEVVDVNERHNCNA